MDTTSAVNSDTPTCFHHYTRFREADWDSIEAYSVEWVDLVIGAQAMTIEAMTVDYQTQTVIFTQ